MKIAAAIAGLALLAPIRGPFQRPHGRHAWESSTGYSGEIVGTGRAVHERICVRKLARVLLCGLGTGLAGCMSFQDVPPREYYVLEDLATAGASRRAAPAGGVLLVSAASTSPFYDTQNLVFSRAPGQRAYYQFAGWTERPGRKLTELLMRRLEARGSFKSVAATTAGIKGDFVFSTRLEEFYHDTGAKPGSVRIEVSVELVDYAGRTMVAQRRFAQSVPAAGENAQGAVAAFNRAATVLLDDLSAWIEGAMAQPVAR
jgi:cholesterol transport system auxiliary component